MSLQQRTSGQEQQQRWYHEPDAVAAQASPPQRYAAEEVERIIAWASALQDAHQQTLSRDQITAIAAEVGIAPEFVHRALEQESAVVVREEEAVGDEGQTSLVAPLSVVLAYAVVTALAMTLSRHSWQPVWTLLFGLLLPGVVAFGLGIGNRSRWRGAALGATLLLSVILVITVTIRAPVRPEEVEIFAAMVGCGGILGAAGAQTRRIVSRRVKKNRGRRVPVRPVGAP